MPAIQLSILAGSSRARRAGDFLTHPIRFFCRHFPFFFARMLSFGPSQGGISMSVKQSHSRSARPGPRFPENGRYTGGGPSRPPIFLPSPTDEIFTKNKKRRNARKAYRKWHKIVRLGVKTGGKSPPAVSQEKGFADLHRRARNPVPPRMARTRKAQEAHQLRKSWASQLPPCSVGPPPREWPAAGKVQAAGPWVPRVRWR